MAVYLISTVFSYHFFDCIIINKHFGHHTRRVSLPPLHRTNARARLSLSLIFLSPSENSATGGFNFFKRYAQKKRIGMAVEQ